MPIVTVEGVVSTGKGKASTIRVGAFPHYPGTLNLTVGEETRNMLLGLATHTFESDHSFNVYLEGGVQGLPVWVGFSRHRVGIELFAQVNLRETFGWRDGDIVKVDVHVNS